jgi:hypothetical protein
LFEIEKQNENLLEKLHQLEEKYSEISQLSKEKQNLQSSDKFN